MKRESLIVCKWMLNGLSGLFIWISRGTIFAATFFNNCVKHVEQRLQEPPL